MASQREHQPASSELLSSAKLVAEAAKSTFNKESDKVDKAKVAGAAADLLDAAQGYGKLDKEKGIGQYVEKAENYLHQYENSGKSAPTTTTDHFGTPNKGEGKPEFHGKDSESGGGVGDYMKMAQGFLGTSNKAEGKPESHGKDSGSGDGVGEDYMKKAQGFLGTPNKDEGKPQSHGKDSGSGSGVGDYMKMAQGFLGK